MKVIPFPHYDGYTITEWERYANILAVAVYNGYTFNPDGDTIILDAEAFLLENIFDRREHHQVDRGTIHYTDHMGYEYQASGEFLCKMEGREEYQKIINSLGEVILLYHDHDLTK